MIICPYNGVASTIGANDYLPPKNICPGFRIVGANDYLP